MGRERVERHYSAERTTARLLAALKRATDARRSTGVDDVDGSAKVAVVLVNYHAFDDLAACLDSLRDGRLRRLLRGRRGQRDRCGCRRVGRAVPGGRPAPPSAQLGIRRWLQHRDRPRPLNRGADHVLVLNLDTTVPPDILTEARRRDGRRDDRGLRAVDGGLRRTGRVDVRRATMDYKGRCDYLAGRRTVGRRAGARRTSTSRSSTAAAMLIRGACSTEVGLFDERYFLNYEDIDLCARIRAAGYRLVMVPSAWYAAQGQRHDRCRPACSGSTTSCATACCSSPTIAEWRDVSSRRWPRHSCTAGATLTWRCARSPAPGSATSSTAASAAARSARRPATTITKEAGADDGPGVASDAPARAVKAWPPAARRGILDGRAAGAATLERNNALSQRLPSIPGRFADEALDAWRAVQIVAVEQSTCSTINSPVLCLVGWRRTVRRLT